MKNIILWGLVCVFTLTHLSSCMPKAKHFEIHVLLDVTDTDIHFHPQKTANYLQQKLEISTNKVSYASANIYLGLINEFRHNPILHKISLAPINVMEDKTKVRITQQQEFLEQLHYGLLQLEDTPISKLSSSMVVQPISDRLNDLQTGLDTNTIFLIFSDMLHNKENISFYSDDVEKLEAFLKAKLQRNQNPPLVNTELWCIYAPSSLKQDLLFQQNKELWQQAIEPTGANIYFKSNL